MFRVIFIVLLLINRSFSSAQSKDTILAVEMPIKNGKVHLFDEYQLNFSDPVPFLLIESDSTAVYSLCDGIVKSILKNDDVFYLAIKTDKGMFVTYGNLGTVMCKVNERIEQCEILGLLRSNHVKDENTLIFQVFSKKINSNYNTTLKYLKKYAGIE